MFRRPTPQWSPRCGTRLKLPPPCAASLVPQFPHPASGARLPQVSWVGCAPCASAASGTSLLGPRGLLPLCAPSGGAHPALGPQVPRGGGGGWTGYRHSLPGAGQTVTTTGRGEGRGSGRQWVAQRKARPKARPPWRERTRREEPPKSTPPGGPAPWPRLTAYPGVAPLLFTLERKQLFGFAASLLPESDLILSSRLSPESQRRCRRGRRGRTASTETPCWKPPPRTEAASHQVSAHPTPRGPTGTRPGSCPSAL